MSYGYKELRTSDYRGCFNTVIFFLNNTHNVISYGL